MTRAMCAGAYMLGADRTDFRANDDGEPSSTAGKPILGQINKNELTDILIIVVRYYGGVNLGTSGLIVAYRTAAAEAIANAEVVSQFVEEEVVSIFLTLLMNDVMKSSRTCRRALSARLRQHLRDETLNS